MLSEEDWAQLVSHQKIDRTLWENLFDWLKLDNEHKIHLPAIIKAADGFVFDPFTESDCVEAFQLGKELHLNEMILKSAGVFRLVKVTSNLHLLKDDDWKLMVSRKGINRMLWMNLVEWITEYGNNTDDLISSLITSCEQSPESSVCARLCDAQNSVKSFLLEKKYSLKTMMITSVRGLCRHEIKRDLSQLSVDDWQDVFDIHGDTKLVGGRMLWKNLATWTSLETAHQGQLRILLNGSSYQKVDAIDEENCVDALLLGRALDVQHLVLKSAWVVFGADNIANVNKLEADEWGAILVAVGMKLSRPLIQNLLRWTRSKPANEAHLPVLLRGVSLSTLAIFDEKNCVECFTLSQKYGVMQLEGSQHQLRAVPITHNLELMTGDHWKKVVSSGSLTRCLVANLAQWVAKDSSHRCWLRPILDCAIEIDYVYLC
jgi:hypothetical protein